MSFTDVTIETVLSKWRWVGLHNYREVLGSTDFHSSLWHTVEFLLAVLIAGVGGGLAAALLLERGGAASRGAFMLMLFIWALPPVVTGTLWKFLFQDRGAVNLILGWFGLGGHHYWLSDPGLALWSVAFVTSWIAIPFVTLVFRAALQDVPVEIREAARIDGAGAVPMFWYITLPFLRPVVAIVGILIVVYSFRSFDFIYVMTSGGPGTVSSTLPYLGYVESFVKYQFASGAAIAVLAMLIVCGFAVVYARFAAREGVD